MLICAHSLVRREYELAAYAIETLALMCGPNGGDPVRKAVRGSTMEPLLRRLSKGKLLGNSLRLGIV